MGLVRLFLALVVAGDHWRVIELPSLSPHMDDHLKLGFNSGYAVLFFYVISGFLITYTLSRNYSRDLSGVREFYRQREGQSELTPLDINVLVPQVVELGSEVTAVLDNGDGTVTAALADGRVIRALGPSGVELGVELNKAGGAMLVGSKGKLIHDTYGLKPRLLPASLHDSFGAPPRKLSRIPDDSHEMNWVDAAKGKTARWCRSDNPPASPR